MTDLRTTEPAPTLAPERTGAPCEPVLNPLQDHDISARALGKSFGNSKIFSEVSFRLVRGEAAALGGANGTGKSTLLRCLLGLIPMDHGTVELLGQDISQLSTQELRRMRASTGLVAQKHNLVPRLSVLSNVIHGLLGQFRGPRYWAQSFASQDAREAAMEALDKVGLAHLALRRADRLSGGQSQRVAIARALVSRPRLLIADEPCASLDPSAGEDIMAMFFELVRSEDVTVIFTSHHLEHALAYGDRVLGLAGGRLELDATAASLSASDLRGLYD